MKLPRSPKPVSHDSHHGWPTSGL